MKLVSHLAGTLTPKLTPKVRRMALAWLSRLVTVAMYRELSTALPNVTAALLGLASDQRGPMYATKGSNPGLADPR